LGNTHIRKSLQTRDIAEANRKKHSVVAEIKDNLHQLRVAHASGDSKTPSGMTFADVWGWLAGVVTKLEQGGVIQSAIARFVGHKVGTLAADTYSAGSSKKQAVETSRRVQYSREVEGVLLQSAVGH
jgi:hypothetical protein